MEAEARLEEFIDRFTREVAELGRQILTKVRQVVPACTELVYDNYNGLVVGFSPDGRPSSAAFSVVFLPRHVSVCFLQGATLPDPHGLLEGEGHVARHVKLRKAEEFDRPELQDMLATALATARVPYPVNGERSLVIQSVSAKQRPRRPSGR